MKTKVRVRFAPSPTGLMHIGGMRTALFNYLFAKHADGDFILRLEDTDRERLVEAGVEQIQRSLDWLGLRPNEGYWLGKHIGKFGPYVQSQRLPHYQDYAKQLVDTGLAYYSHISANDFKTLRESAMAAKRPFVYRQEMESKGSSTPSKNLPIRLKVTSGMTKWQDELRGGFELNNDLIDDFIILKADGFPTYNFASVIDDHMMQISHVIRGDEFIASTPKHAMLYDLLKWQRPRWIHLPVINGASGKKLSKRDGDTDVLDYETRGYLPSALINFLALLGWNDGTTQEIFSLDELIDKFDYKRLQKSPAIFDKERLEWMNGVYIREKISQPEYLKRVTSELEKAGIDIKKHTTEYIAAAANLERERIKTFDQAADLLDFFFITPDLDSSQLDLICAKGDKAEVGRLLEAAASELSNCSDNTKSIEDCLRQLADELDIKSGQLFYPIRVALTGKTAAPGLFETIAVLGITESTKRIKAAAQAL